MHETAREDEHHFPLSAQQLQRIEHLARVLRGHIARPPSMMAPAYRAVFCDANEISAPRHYNDGYARRWPCTFGTVGKPQPGSGWCEMASIAANALCSMAISAF